MCDHCEKSKPLLQRNSKKVVIQKGNHLRMWWKTHYGNRRCEWSVINYCPMCGRDLREGEQPCHSTC